MRRTLLALATSMLSAGCAATLESKVVYQGVPANPARDRAIAESAERGGVSGADSVDLFLDRWPAGFEIARGGVRVKAGFEHKVLGSALLYIRNDGVSIPSGPAALFSFPDYSDRWRRTYCYPQTILTWPTLGMWAVVPFAWPCWADNEIPQDQMASRFKNAAAAAGGDAVLATYDPAPRGISVDGLGRAVGYVVRLDRRQRGK